MSDRPEELHELPIRLEPVDIEGATEPMAIVACPRRAGEAMALTLCGHCALSQRVAFSQSGATLACEASEASRAATSCTSHWVHEFVRLPTICASVDTSIGVILKQLIHRHEAFIPVLDAGRRLVGVLSARELLASSGDSQSRRALAGEVMRPAPPSIRFDASLADALRSASHDAAAQWVVTDARGRFLGIVDRTEFGTGY